jgi:hypothetical protein
MQTPKARGSLREGLKCPTFCIALESANLSRTSTGRPPSQAGSWTRHRKASPEVEAIDRFQFGERGFREMKVIELVPPRVNGSALTASGRGSVPN